MEKEFIRWLRAHTSSHPNLVVGPGDDAAVLRAQVDSESVVTCDLLADGVHFQLDRDSAQRIGHKALGVNLSDLAAMAAVPVAGFVTVALPRKHGLTFAQQLFEGMQPLADRYELAIAGGDTNTWDGPLVISATLIGRTTRHGPLLRSGARPGDQLVVSGCFGGSLLGHHLDFEPRVHEALLLAEAFRLHAGMDCSDGLALDSSRLAEESGCGVVIDVANVPISEAVHQLAGRTGRSPLDHALGDGEDFELILALPANEAERLLAEQPLDIPLTRIGEFIDQQGLWCVQDGQRTAMRPQGYLHGATDG
jgi:thiamine-monophosphate kinase